jgi:SAM-dependent methyltransferase
MKLRRSLPMPEPQAVRIGRFVAVAHADHQEMDRLAERLLSRGFGARETGHFVVCRRGSRSRQVIVMHTFSQATVDEDLSPMVADELGPLGVVASPHDYGSALFAIVASTSPAAVKCPTCGEVHLDPPTIWRTFSVNTLERLRTLIASDSVAPPAGMSHVAQFARIYRRIFDHVVGDTLLDVGSNLGLLPVLLAERFSALTVVGCDNRADAVACGADLAQTTGNDRVTFRVRDVLAVDFGEIGRFDTVTAVHVLEHLTQGEVPVALTRMFQATARRLIVSVPYEDAAQRLYGHRQQFTVEKLRFWGDWCVDALGAERFWCEEASGGMLVIDRSPDPAHGISYRRPAR